ncbi:tRNA (adenosine(37)-N6)-dimethylallyltransferase MiaA [Chloroflexi bacterium TSY]|nr:tRNA (adenosine(37)-N6)-dimethylallyltransferase MiaA [Chloroflexi bacterium TSY]
MSYKVASSSPLPLLIALLGPTAVGKTSLSIELCQTLNGEVISADSRQVYRTMDIGTAKPSVAERTQAPHHLFDIRNPDEPLSVSEYQRLAFETIDAVHARDHIPLLVGGSALYLRSVVQGLRIPEVPPNPELRLELEEIAQTEGWKPLFQRLRILDPATATQIDPKNLRRVIRALEIVITTGKSKIELEGSQPPPYPVIQIGLDRPRELLYQRIDQRVEEMVNRGLLDETRRLLEAGYATTAPAMTSLGYREMSAYLNGEMSLDEAIEKTKIETHRFVRHQYTWFRKMENIVWFDLEQTDMNDIVTHISDLIRG